MNSSKTDYKHLNFATNRDPPISISMASEIKIGAAGVAGTADLDRTCFGRHPPPSSVYNLEVSSTTVHSSGVKARELTKAITNVKKQGRCERCGRRYTVRGFTCFLGPRADRFGRAIR